MDGGSTGNDATSGSDARSDASSGVDGGQASDAAGDGPSDAGADAPAEGAAGPLPDYASGTRLRAKVYKTPDGTKLWHGWFDSTLGTACTFSQGIAEDGATRCMPPAAAGYYSDAACTNPITVISGAGCSAPAYVSLAAKGTPCSLSAYSVGAAVDAGTTVYNLQGTSCVAAVVAGTVYAVTHVAASSLVAATPATDPKSVALSAAYLRADDGALEPRGAADRGRDAGCAPLTGGYATACAPSDLIYAPAALFSDMACTVRAARTLDHACSYSTSPTVEVQTADSCGNVSIALSAIGVPLATSYVVPYGGSCTVGTTPTGFTDHTLGAAIPASSLPTVGTVDVGSGRIATRYLQAPTGEKIAPATWVDTQLGATCQVLLTANGLRCVPGQYRSGGYSDSNCMNAVVYFNQPSGCPVPTPPSFVQWSAGTSTCVDPQVARLFQVGSQVTGIGAGGVYVDAPTCGPTGINPNGLAFFSATEIDTATLPAITDVTE
jgi:hypothetical protein